MTALLRGNIRSHHGIRAWLWVRSEPHSSSSSLHTIPAYPGRRWEPRIHRTFWNNTSQNYSLWQTCRQWAGLDITGTFIDPDQRSQPLALHHCSTSVSNIRWGHPCPSAPLWPCARDKNLAFAHKWEKAKQNKKTQNPYPVKKLGETYLEPFHAGGRRECFPSWTDFSKMITKQTTGWCI